MVRYGESGNSGLEGGWLSHSRRLHLPLPKQRYSTSSRGGVDLGPKAPKGPKAPNSPYYLGYGYLTDGNLADGNLADGNLADGNLADGNLNVSQPNLMVDFSHCDKYNNNTNCGVRNNCKHFLAKQQHTRNTMNYNDLIRYSTLSDSELHGIAEAYWAHAGLTPEAFAQLTARIDALPLNHPSLTAFRTHLSWLRLTHYAVTRARRVG
jgi:hypothetical protein